MKRLLTINLTIALLTGTAQAGLIVHSDYTSGTSITAAGQNANENTIFNEFNGNIDNTNIKTGGIATANIAAGAVTSAKLDTSLALTTVTMTTGTITNSIGIVDGSSALAGNLGEYKESVISGSPVTFPTSTQWGDVTSLSLTAGDWDVQGRIVVDNNTTASITVARIGISATSGNSSTGLVVGNNHMVFSNGAGLPAITSHFINSYRVSISATTTYYLKHNITYTSTAGNTSGILSARRVR